MDTRPTVNETSDMSFTPDPETVPMRHWSEPAAPSSKIETSIAPGSVVGGRYEILKILGRGGMGAVCQARDLEVDRIVAVKFIRGELAGKASVLQRFKRELVLAQKVTHPNVVRIYDLGVAGDMRFITMEYIDGEELSKVILERGKLPPREAVGIMIQVCKGLAAAHTVGIVHRDLKPANIMIDKQGRVAVMDFGIAYSIEAAAVAEDAAADVPSGPLDHLTKAGSMIGTPTFMSPEQARGEHVDHRSDLFTVGFLLYALISGKLPTGSTLQETLKIRGSKRIKPLIELEPTVPLALNDIVGRCLELQPGRRYQSADELARALEDWSRSQEAAPSKRSHGRRVATAGILAAALGAAGLFAYLNRRTEPPTPAHSIKVLINDFTNATGNPLLDGLVDPMVGIGLEGARFITVFNRGQARRIASELSGSPALDVKTSQLITRREGIDVIVGGSVARDNNKFKLSIDALDGATGKVIAQQSATVDSPDQLARAVSSAVARVRKQLGDATPLATQLASAETFSSGSLEAARDYSRAQELQWRGKLDDALAAFQLSVKEDPDFGRAYAGMAATLANLGRRKDAEEAYRMAMSKIDRMSDREKYRTRGGYFLLRREYDRAVEQYQELVKQYPADTAGLGNLALAYFYQRNMAGAVEEGRRAVAIYPNNLLQIDNVGLYEMYAGDFDSARREFLRVLASNASYEKAYIGLGLSRLAQGNNSEAEESYRKLAALGKRGASMASLATADLALVEGRMNEAFATLDAGIQADKRDHEGGREASKWITMAEGRLIAGQRAQAAISAGRALSADSDDKILYAAAKVYVAASQKAKAGALLAQLNSRLGPDAELYSKLIAAEISLERGDYREAISRLQAAQKVSDSWLGRFALGRTYLVAGAFTEADSEFEVCLKRRGEATAVFLDDEPRYHYFPPVYYYLGLAREGLGSRGAADAYRAFLKLKEKSGKDAMVDDARKRLSAVSAGSPR